MSRINRRAAAASATPTKTKNLRDRGNCPQVFGGSRLPQAESSTTLTTGKVHLPTPLHAGYLNTYKPYHTSGSFSVPPPSRIRVCPPSTDLQVYYITKLCTCQVFFIYFLKKFCIFLGGTTGGGVVDTNRPRLYA